MVIFRFSTIECEILVNRKYFQLLLLCLLAMAASYLLMFAKVTNSQAQSLQSWSGPINISNSGSSSTPSIVVDQRGTIHVLWIDALDGYKYAQSTDGLTWTLPISVKFPFLPSKVPPRFIVGTNGIVHILWRDKDNTLYYASAKQEDIGNPSSWSSKNELDSNILDFDSKLDSSGAIHVAYLKSRNAKDQPAGIYYTSSSPNGDAWSPALNLFESQYFRSLDSDQAHVRIAVSDGEGSQKNVYVVWDNSPQKRIMIARSANSGMNWDGATDIIVPDLQLENQTPANVEITASNQHVLLLWQNGGPGSRCAEYSQSSADGGNTWSESVSVFGDTPICPERTDFFTLDEDNSLAIFSVLGNISLVAWNGNHWSFPQNQDDLLSLFNPLTFDLIALGCEQYSVISGKLYLVGCDEGSSGDIWITWRELGSMVAWFPPPASWSPPVEVLHLLTGKISSMTLQADQKNDLNAFWIQSTLPGEEIDASSIWYAHREGEIWSPPISILAEFHGMPTQLSVVLDQQDRLLLVWVDKKTGDMLFSWGNLDQANSPSGWAQIQYLPSPSKLISSPTISVDGAGRIIITFAVSANEERGIYIIQSDSLGKGWSTPVRIFNGVSANWDMIGEPRMALTADGRLHVLVSRFTLQGNQLWLEGLYYSQSTDGGITWSNPEAVSTHNVQWGDIVGYDREIIHRVWQEKDGTVTYSFHQVSRNGGQTWDSPIGITSTDDDVLATKLVIDKAGQLHLFQLLYSDTLGIQEWIWDGAQWSLLETKVLDFKGRVEDSMIAASISSSGSASILASIGYFDSAEIFAEKLINLNRSLNFPADFQPPALAVMSTPNYSSSSTPISEMDVNTTQEPNQPLQGTPPSLLSGMNESSRPLSKNLVGLLLITITLVLAFFVIFKSRRH